MFGVQELLHRVPRCGCAPNIAMALWYAGEGKRKYTSRALVTVKLTNSSSQATASKLVSFLCREIKPRYHFCAINGTHYESAPFRMPKDETTQFELCTRFISLAEVGNAEKAKYIYALSLKPVDKSRLLDLVQKTTNEIPCPFIGLDLGGAISKNDSVGNLYISISTPSD